MKSKLLTMFLILGFIFVSCSSVSDKDLFEAGKKKIEEKNYVEAINDFQKIVNDFPEGEYEVKAMYELAKLYHGHVIKTMTKEESLSKAVGFYKRVHEKSPDSVEGEKSLFMAGFLEANELNRINDAEKTYKLFLKNYPKSPLAASAEVEIKNLGIPPEEILKKNVSLNDGK